MSVRLAAATITVPVTPVSDSELTLRGTRPHPVVAVRLSGLGTAVHPRQQGALELLRMLHY